MRVRTLLSAAMLVAVGLIAAMAVAGWFMTGRLAELSQTQERAQSAAREVASLLVLTHEYALYGEERAVQQWLGHHRHILAILDSGGGDLVPVAHEALPEARRLGENFQRLIEAGSDEGELRARRVDLVLGQLLTGAQILNESVHTWAGEAEEARQQAEQWVHVLATAIPVAMLVVLAALAALVSRRLLHPLAALHRAVEAVARGDLTVRHASRAEDEFGDLSRTFDAMAVDMVAQLRKEVAERTEAERALAAANRELAEHEALLAQILDTSSVAIFLLDPKGRILHANRRMTEMYGFALDALIGMEYVQLVHPAEMQHSRQKLLALLESEIQSVSVERRYSRADRSEFWGHLTGSRFIDAEGNYRGLVCVIADITERKLADQELRNAKAIVDSTDDAVIGKTLAGIITTWNPGAERIFGYSPAEAVGHPVQMLIPPERSDEGERLLSRIAQGERIDHFETVRLRRDGRRIDVSVTISPIQDETGRIVGSSKIARDITGQKRAEAELARHRDHLESLVEERTAALSIAKEAAEAANRAKSVFLANMSHELRTPMNAIMGMTELARRRAADPAQASQLGLVAKSAVQLLGIINDILDLSKIEAEHLSLERIDFILGGVFENLVSLTSQKAQEKGLALVADMDSRLGQQTLRGDPLRLGQVLLNLTGNAIKFTAAGSVTVAARVIRETDDDIELRFEIRDTGIGILPEDQGRVFTAFEQADGSTTRKYGGTGLGLAISKRLVHAMGGEIGVDSRPGEGSTFWFSTRFDKSQGALDVPAADSNAAIEEQLRTRYAGVPILLAEDEPINQEVSQSLLNDVGLDVALAGDGEEAVAMAQRHQYRLILMDVQMPRMNGLDAARVIRALPGYDDIPILAMTANAFADDRQRCLEAGMDDHIAKPVDPDLLFETVLKWLNRKADDRQR